MKEIEAKAKRWLDSNIDEQAKAEIKALLNDPEALTEAFYKDLEFGTGGLRGIMGMGSNRINRYTVGMATQGLANYLIKTYPDDQIKVAIAHDCRNNSSFFAETVAAVFSANNIKVYLFDGLRPTPELSFAIRHLNCQSGVVLTASHNPKEYNGYKAYWNDGGQLVSPHDRNVIQEVNKISSVNEVKFTAKEELIEKIGEEIDQIYLNEIKKESLSPDIVRAQKDIKIVYSPIHGTGTILVPQCLKNFGFENVHIVEEQAAPDGNFPTVVYPNPEEAEALKLALQKAKEIDAELVMATDPDADRVGIAVKNPEGNFQLLNGNQTGSLLIYYILKKWEALKKFEGNEFIVKTIVTTELISKIAQHFEVACYDTLTGFKYIASLIRELEGKQKFIAGGEESYGYLIGDFVRDKDAIASCAMIAEMCAYARSEGKSLFDLLLEVYAACGFYKEKLISITKQGKQGAEEIALMMQNFRNSPPTQLGGSKVVKVTDYLEGTAQNLITKETEKINFEKSNVLQFFTDKGYKISARPSGTEPKIKFYISVNKDLTDPSAFKATDKELDELLAGIEQDLRGDRF